jgi:glycosyltransferase involved in cell wall biosynthesis
MTPTLPFFTVIVPAHNAEKFLPETLGTLEASDVPRNSWELIVVDDASADATAAVAARFADTVVRLPGRPHGPAYARNRGFEVSRGSIVVFLDADVVAHADTLRRLVEVLTESPGVGAVFGSYDCEPPAPGFMSQYRNLLHHYVHQRNAGDSETFWAGAGAIRRSVFDEAGMYDEWHYARPQIEDIELGGRVCRLGHRILLRPDIQVTHLKRWTFAGVVRTDLRDRGIPWARLLLHRKAFAISGRLNLRMLEKLCTVLVWLGCILLVVALWTRSGVWALLAAVPPALAMILNAPLLAFFARTRGFFFALRVIPVQLMYYVLTGISFAVGLMLKEMVGAPIVDPTTEAYSEMGVTRWPPVPSRARPSSWTTDPE